MADMSSKARELAQKMAPDDREGPVARNIERVTSRIPSDAFLWAAGGAIAGALTLHVMDRKEDAIFVGHWAPSLLLLGLYNKLVKVAGSDRHDGDSPRFAH